MFRLACIISAVLVAVFAAPAPEGNEERIMGGTTALPGEYPYTVSLRTDSNMHFCGGGILNSHTIITAASCLTGKTPATTIVVAGTNLLNSGGYRYPVAKFKPHPAYNPDVLGSDIALVITSTGMDYSNTIARIGLPTDINIAAGVAARLTGWGTTSYPNGALTNNMQTIILNTITREECKSKLEGIGNVYVTQICTLNRAGRGMCQGDAGSPLVEKGLLIGIASWGVPCAAGLPDVFTRVADFRSWITSNAQNE